MALRLIFIITALMFVDAIACAAVGTKEISFLSKKSKRTIVAEIYYPVTSDGKIDIIQHGVWLREKPHDKELTLAKNQLYPLVVFSHGYQGDRFGVSWLAEGLVAKGYIVVMIDHTFNTSYEQSDLFMYTSMWQRPLDISELLTVILQHPQWGKVINKDRIAVAGFSLGGTTALWLGGIRANKDQLKKSLDDKYARWDDWPQAVIKQAKSVDWSKAEQSYQDKRIKAIVSIAPDLGDAFAPDGLKHMQVPTLIIAGDKDQITPKEQNAEFYSKNITGSEILVLTDVEHFTFLNKCSSLGVRLIPHVCSTDDKKDEAHTAAVNKISDFLEKTLG